MNTCYLTKFTYFLSHVKVAIVNVITCTYVLGTLVILLLLMVR